jgi:hypothetical protein
MIALFESGHIVDWILAFTLIEAAIIIAHHQRTGLGVTPGDLAGNLFSGVSLMLALRCALSGANWVWVGFWLFGALLAHLYDLNRRWRRR